MDQSLRRLFRKTLDQKQNVQNYIPAILGNGSGVVAVPNTVNRVYVRVADSVQEVVNNGTVPAVNDYPVWIGTTPMQPDVKQVLGLRSGAVFEGAGAPDLSAIAHHAASHRWLGSGVNGGTDPVFIELRQFLPLRVGATTGLNINVYPGLLYLSGALVQVSTATAIDLTSYVPARSLGAAMGKFVLVYVNSAGTVAIADGTAKDVTTLTAADIPAVPAGGTRLAAVRLYTGQTAIYEAKSNNDIIDLRFSSLTGGSSETTITDHDHSGDAGDGGAFPLVNLLSTGASDGQVATANGSGGIAWETPAAGSGAAGILPVPRVDGTLTLLSDKITVTDDSGTNELPGLTTLEDGTLFLVYRSGTTHSSDKGSLVKKTSTDGGATWSTETTIYTDATYDSRDPSVTRLKSGRLLVSFKKYNYSAGASLVDGCYTLYSDDGGATWSTPVQLDSAWTGWAGCSMPVIELPDGTLMLAIFGANSGDTYQSVSVMTSSDQGDTWGGEVVVARGADYSRHFQEPNLVLLNDGRILCMMRSDTPNPAGGHIYASYSSDLGATWSAPADQFAGSGNPHTIQLSNGMLLTIYRRWDSASGEAVYRTSLNNGQTWSAVAYLDASSAIMVYASPCEYKPGIVGVAYSVVPGAETNSDLFFKRFYLTLEGGQIVSNVPTGTAPLVVQSATAVTNLNADLLDGYHAADLLGGAGAATGETLVDDTASEGAFLYDDSGDILYEG